ncbi:MAG: T9SS type A sorting domain-containing protein [Bacteroidales bacterium]|jgi:uncharacterized protein (TIGR02145 family)|nr:T9SS type A sorting domain-containing protein [Bacteroidales bacterium]
MKKLILFLIAWPILNYGQHSMTFSFTGINDSTYVQLDSIKVKNLTQDCDTVLHYPDTVLTIYYAGISEDGDSVDGFRVMQNYPNPVSDQTLIRICSPQSEMVSITVSDATGRQLLTSSRFLEKGLHAFIFTPPGDGIYLFRACSKNVQSTIRILAMGNDILRTASLEYAGGTPLPGEIPLKSETTTGEFLFSPGDQLLLIGYGNELESGFLDSPETSQDYVFRFATNIPCPGLDSLLYDGQWYHTVQVFSQCWLKENMNVGTMIPSAQDQDNNDIIEKYCMGDMESYCNLFGGLYFWNEMMNYATITGGQGICPDGFHVPTDLEWQILEGAADSSYGIGGPEWKVNGWRGSDAGGNLKQTGTGLWEYPNTGATDAYGMTVVPAGYFVQGGFWGPGYKTYIWSSNYVSKYYRNMDWNQAKIQRNTGGNEVAFSVRCVRN